VASLSAATAARAADLNAPPPPVEEEADIPYANPYNWTGLYLGASGGFGFANVDHYYDRQNGQNDHGQVWLDASGYTFSGHLGYNYHLPSNLVVGVEGEIGNMSINEDRIVIKDDDHLRFNSGLFGTLRGKLGYAMGPFMPYITGGFGFIDIENAGGNPDNDQRYVVISETRTGVAVGAGAEYMLSKNLVARLEYMHINTGEFEVRNLENEKMTFDNDVDIVRAGLSFKF
jgi:opacity protein-like surface antigen